jgi:hypothetical protein
VSKKGAVVSRKRKRPKMWRSQWFMIELYQPVGLLRRKRFYLIATTHRVAEQKLIARWPNAKILMISNVGI